MNVYSDKKLSKNDYLMSSLSSTSFIKIGKKCGFFLLMANFWTCLGFFTQTLHLCSWNLTLVKMELSALPMFWCVENKKKQKKLKKKQSMSIDKTQGWWLAYSCLVHKRVYLNAWS